MYEVSEIIPALLKACPTAEPPWEEHLVWWGEEERGVYNDLAVFAHHIVGAAREGRTSEFEAFFSLLEALLEHSDEDLKGLVIFGLIETIQVIASHYNPAGPVIEQWLGPRSLEAWLQIEKIWEGKSSLMDVLRAEASQRQPEEKGEIP